MIARPADLVLVDPPYYARVPTDRRENLRWRLAVLKRARHDADFRDAMRQMCADDALFFINGFCLIYEPRNKPPKSKIFPFILWPHQVAAARIMQACHGRRDYLVDKSRGEGASWLELMLNHLHPWLFEPGYAGAIVSKDEDSVDVRNDVSRMMPKLDWQLDHLPAWLRPAKIDRTFKDHTLRNGDNGAVITGYASTGDVGSGGRATHFTMDEMAKFPKGADYDAMTSTQHITNSRGIISTYKGDSGAYFDLARDEHADVVRVVLDWKDNPTKNRGLYRVKNGQVEAVDAANPIDPLYLEKLPDIHRRLTAKGFKVEGTTRSEWYNTQCLRSNPISVAEEIDRDPCKSGEKYFDRDVIDNLIRTIGREPVHTGIIEVLDGSTRTRPEVRFLAANGGYVKLWCPINQNGNPPRGVYVFGADISAGTGGDHCSNSALIGVDARTREQVFEFASNAIPVHEFARLSVAVCLWFYGGWLNWEANGPNGESYGLHVTERLEYLNVYFRNQNDASLEKTKTDRPGWNNSSDAVKLAALSAVVSDCLEGKLTLRSDATLREFCEYGYVNGKIEHIRSKRTAFESSKGKAHGDRAIAAAAMRIALDDFGLNVPQASGPPREDGPLQRMPYNCMANRLLDHEDAKRREREVWA
jgi:hypothetical protein